MPIPDPASIDTTKSYVLEGETLKQMIVVIKSLWRMTNNNPNALTMRTVNICEGSTVYKTEIICTQPRTG